MEWKFWLGVGYTALALTCSASDVKVKDFSTIVPSRPFYVNVDGNLLPVSFDGGRGPEKRDDWKRLNAVSEVRFTAETDTPLDLMVFDVEGLPEDACSVFRLYPAQGVKSYRAQFMRDRSKSVAARNKFALLVEGPIEVKAGENIFYLKTTPEKTIDLDARIRVTCSTLLREQKPQRPDKITGTTQRAAYALRKRGEDGVHTARIPGLETTSTGSLIAVYDNRYNHWHDLPADIDVGMSQSHDGGRTWLPMKNIMDFKDGVGDPAVLCDPANGRIWVAALWSRFGWGNTGTGLSPETTGQFAVTYSDNDGRSWAAPYSITEQTKDSSWHIFFNGPGKGIVLRDGTLVFPAQFQADTVNSRGKQGYWPFSTIIWSKDHGKTWHTGTGCQVETTEAQIVELENGEIMINCRNDAVRSRAVYTTGDLGQTWIRHSASEKTDQEGGLQEPRCQASFIRAHWPQSGEPGILLFSNPNTTSGRTHMTIKASINDGLSWPHEFQVHLDDYAGQYSCMTMINPETVGILYEGGDHILTFMRIPLADILGY